MSDPRGMVYLVGAGPGDPGLITVRGLELVQQADVILHDRLVSPDLLKRSKPTAEILNVGKAPGCHRFSGAQTNALIVHHAARGKIVVRLKGGDPFVFGRGTEEMDACRAAGVDVAVIPGVSSALAAPAAAGIPMTQRGLARSFAVFTARSGEREAAFTWSDATLTAIDTLVFMMGRARLPALMQRLLAAGRPPRTPAACIEQATTPRQRTVLATVATLADACDREGLETPAVIVVGEVVNRAETQSLPQMLSNLICA